MLKLKCYLFAAYRMTVGEFLEFSEELMLLSRAYGCEPWEVSQKVADEHNQGTIAMLKTNGPVQ